MSKPRIKSTPPTLPWLVSILVKMMNWRVVNTGISPVVLRSDEDEQDDGVCSMKEIQEVTLYRGIDSIPA